jgi:hypothetical protein
VARDAGIAERTATKLTIEVRQAADLAAAHAAEAAACEAALKAEQEARDTEFAERIAREATNGSDSGTALGRRPRSGCPLQLVSIGRGLPRLTRRGRRGAQTWRCRTGPVASKRRWRTSQEPRIDDRLGFQAHCKNRRSERGQLAGISKLNPRRRGDSFFYKP